METGKLEIGNWKLAVDAANQELQIWSFEFRISSF